MTTIIVFYSCPLCGLIDAPVEVPVRQSGDTTERWMRDLSVYCSEDHRDRSPRCKPTMLHNVKIPVSRLAPVGSSLP